MSFQERNAAAKRAARPRIYYLKGGEQQFTPGLTRWRGDSRPGCRNWPPALLGVPSRSHGTSLRGGRRGPPIAHRGEGRGGRKWAQMGPPRRPGLITPPPSGSPILSPTGLCRSAEPRHLPLQLEVPSFGHGLPLLPRLIYRRPGSHATRSAAAAIGTNACCSPTAQGPPIQP